MVSGGSSASWSVTCAADHVGAGLAGEVEAGIEVNVVGPPDTVAVWRR